MARSMVDYGMAKTKAVDRLGRVVLPKSLRERYGLTGGAELELTDTGNGILLTPRRASTALRQLKNGFPVLSLAGAAKGDLKTLIDATRQERDARNYPREGRADEG